MSLQAYSSLLCKGVIVTASAWILTFSLSLSLGLLIGIAGCRMLSSVWKRRMVHLYTFIAKGIPAYVQILLAYFVIPSLLSIEISGFFAGILALSFCSSGYVAEIVRAGINSIAKGQWEACKVLGYSKRSALVRIILPQVFANILPALVGEGEQLLKSTSLLATIGITELTRSGMNIISRELNPVPVYILIALIYLSFSAVLQCVVFYLERKTYDYR